MNNSNYLLTIAIPTYNGSATITDLLDSILRQYDECIEVLILNNCSTDNTREIIEDYKKRYPYIRIKNQEKNIGPDANFLDCFREAKGRFIHLISDDDIYFDGAIHKIIEFLKNNRELSLVYLNTIGFYGKFSIETCDQKELHKHVDTFVTTEKKRFFEAASHYWGFVSSFICAKSKFSKIINPERYFRTYWLQSYIHILCAQDTTDLLGVVGNPCVGAGRYINVNNFDSVEVDGIYYKKMLDFAVEKAHFDKKQLLQLYKKRFFMLARHNIIKEKAIGIKKMSAVGLFKLTYPYPHAWITVYPFYLIPSFVCRFYNNVYRRKKGINNKGSINRFE